MKKIVLLTVLLLTNLNLIAGNEYAVTTTNLNLRESNTTNSTSLKVIKQGDTLEILSEDSNWSKVKVDNIEGYVATEYLLKIQVNAPSSEVETSKKETFKDQKGFIAGFKFVFIRVFILIFLIVGSSITYSLRKKDARLKKGYREGKMSNSSLIKLAIYSGVVSVVAGLIGGIISIFH